MPTQPNAFNQVQDPIVPGPAGPGKGEAPPPGPEPGPLPSFSLPADPGEILERCLGILERCFRHSAVGRRVTGIVHNMNSPLQVLSFHCELLEKKFQEEERLLFAEVTPETARPKEYHDYRALKLAQLRREVDNLQNQARLIIFQGLHEENQERLFLDLNQICRDELELYLFNPFFKHRVKKNFRFQEGLPSLSGHYIDFSQSFRNLVDNALEAMEGGEERTLTVETAYQNGRLKLRLGDTGAGIAPEILPRVFDPFFTTRGSPDRPRDGLGLFMARRLLRPYRGVISIKSRPGETMVEVGLPV